MKYSGMVVMVVNNNLVVCCRALPRCNPHRQGQLLLEAFRRYEHNDEGEDGYGWSREHVLKNMSFPWVSLKAWICLWDLKQEISGYGRMFDNS